jgi:hypothetical protein
MMLGCMDLIRGVMHTIRVEHAAGEIAGLDLSTPVSIDLLILMVAFGTSNLLTGTMLILLAWKARPLALALLGIIPVAYLVGFVGLQLNTAAYPATQATYPGRQMIMVYLAVCVATFLSAVVQSKLHSLSFLRQESESGQAHSPGNQGANPR